MHFGSPFGKDILLGEVKEFIFSECKNKKGLPEKAWGTNASEWGQCWGYGSVG